MCFKVLKILKCFMCLKLELFKNNVLSTISNLKLGCIFIQFQTFDSKENLPRNHISQKLKCIFSKSVILENCDNVYINRSRKFLMLKIN